MDPCGATALPSNQCDDCPLSITLWNLLLRNLLISVSPEWASPEIPS